MGPSGVRFAYFVKPKAGTAEAPVPVSDVELSYQQIASLVKTDKRVLSVVLASGLQLQTSANEVS